MNEAIIKLQKEIEESKNKYTKVIGDYIIDFLKKNPSQAPKVVDEKKTIKGSLDAMKSEAKKAAVGGMAMLSDDEGFAIVLKYFGLKKEEPKKSGLDFSLEDLF